MAAFIFAVFAFGLVSGLAAVAIKRDLVARWNRRKA
jgi:hypothetical protein